MGKLNQSYEDILKIPVYQRRFFVETLLKSLPKQKNTENVTYSNGKRYTKISGDAASRYANKF